MIPAEREQRTARARADRTLLLVCATVLIAIMAVAFLLSMVVHRDETTRIYGEMDRVLAINTQSVGRRMAQFEAMQGLANVLAVAMSEGRGETRISPPVACAMRLAREIHGSCRWPLPIPMAAACG